MSVQRPPLEPLRPAYRIQYLTDEQLNQLQEATLDILENVGVKFRLRRHWQFLMDMALR